MGGFVALDVETANADLASICQVGLVEFLDGEEVRAWDSLIDPGDFFDSMNTAIHGIAAPDVVGAPSFLEILPTLRAILTDQVVVSHSPFDRTAITRAVEDCCEEPIQCSWLDSARVVRRAWSQFRDRGYGLESVTSALGIEHRSPHVALEDARAAARVLLRAIVESGKDVDAWRFAARQPIGGDLRYGGNPDGPLYGETMVFTGSLSLRRADAAKLAAEAGCTVARSVTQLTTLLVVGQQDLRQLAGYIKSGKHRRAEELIRCGQRLRIMGEQDFQRLIREHQG